MAETSRSQQKPSKNAGDDLVLLGGLGIGSGRETRRLPQHGAMPSESVQFFRAMASEMVQTHGSIEA
jgi:hypothetical protein